MSTPPDRTPTRLSALQDCLYTLDELPEADRGPVIESLGAVLTWCPKVLHAGVDWKAKAGSRKKKIAELEARVDELESDLADWQAAEAEEFEAGLGPAGDTGDET